MTAFRTLQPPQNKKTYTESLNKDTYLWARGTAPACRSNTAKAITQYKL